MNASHPARTITLSVVALLTLASCADANRSSAVDDALVGASEDDAPTPDGVLDCTGDDAWHQTLTIAEDEPGSPTADEALRSTLSSVADRHGAELLIVQPGVASVAADGRELIVAVAIQLPSTGWAVDNIAGCAGFEL